MKRLINWIRECLLGEEDGTLAQFVRYGFVGASAFVVDFSSLWILTDYLGLYYVYSNLIAFTIGLIYSYILTVLWVFKESTYQNKWIEFVVFAIIGIIGLVLNTKLLYLMTEYLSIYYLVSKVIATIVVLFWNFFARKFLLFRMKK